MPGPPSSQQNTSRVIQGSPELSLKTQHSSVGHNPWEGNLSTKSQQLLMSCTQGLSLKTDEQMSVQEMSLERMGQDILKLACILRRASPCRVLPQLGNSEGRETTPHWPRPSPAWTLQSIVCQHRKRGNLLHTRDLNQESASSSHAMLSLDAQTAEEQSLHEISKHKLWANVLLTCRNPAAPNFMRQKSTSFFADNVPMLVTAMPKS